MQADHPSSVALDVLCICGAPYERTEKIVSACDHDSVVCELCGAGLAARHSLRVRVYRLVKDRARVEKPNR